MSTPECCVDLEQITFVEQAKTVSPEFASWANAQFLAGRSVESVKEQVRRVMRVVTPLREAQAPLADNVSQTETEFNLGWADNNPELFAQAVRAFQTKTPITHWRHHVDLSREGFITLMAYRRAQPFNTVRDYLAVEKLYLKETGHYG